MGLIAMSERDLQRIEVLSKVVSGRMTTVSAALLNASAVTVRLDLKTSPTIVLTTKWRYHVFEEHFDLSDLRVIRQHHAAGRDIPVKAAHGAVEQ